MRAPTITPPAGREERREEEGKEKPAEVLSCQTVLGLSLTRTSMRAHRSTLYDLFAALMFLRRRKPGTAGTRESPRPVSSLTAAAAATRPKAAVTNTTLP